MEEKYIFGIDLGTTYSVISYLDDNMLIQTCKNDNGTGITPSVVDFSDSDENPTVGQVAKDNKVFQPQYVFDFFKCEMGNGDKLKYYGEDLTKKTTAIDLSAAVLKYLAKYATDETDSKVNCVVITVPAYFSTVEKEATKKAAEKAGFEEVHLIEEPTAAAVYYGFKGDKKETVLVYDLGGGTFDVVAIEIDGYDYNCFVIEGDQQLGGKQWDERVIDIIKTKLTDKDVDESDLDEEDMAEIQNAAEKAKKALTPQTSTTIKLRLSVGKYEFPISRDEFEAKTKDLLDRTIESTRKVKEEVEAKGKKITKILMVGGSSYMPQVQSRLTAEFPDIEIPNPMDPNMAVSKGAAFYGKSIIAEAEKRRREREEKKEEKFVLTPSEKIAEKSKFEIGTTEVVTISKISVSSIGMLGRVGNEKIIKTILYRGAKLPVIDDMDFPLSADAIKFGTVDLSLYEHRSEEEYVSPNEKDIKQLETKSGEISKGLPSGSTIHIHMEIDEEGLLQLVATDPNGVSIKLETKAEAKSGNE